MNKNLFRNEWKRNRGALVIWTLLISALIIIPMSFYHTLADNQKQFSDIFEIFPKEMMQFKGISNISDLFSILGFYATSISAAMMLLSSIFSIILSSSIILKEETHKTAEFLLSKPLSRTEIFLSKFAVVFLSILILNIITTLTGFISLEIFKTEAYSIKAFLTLSIYIFHLNLLFGALGIFISTLVKRPKSVTVLCIGLVLVFFFIYNLSKISEKAAFMGYISPFGFVNTDVIKASYSLSLGSLSYFIGLSIVFIISSILIYRRKDILV